MKKLNRKTLRKVIKEELRSVLSENYENSIFETILRNIDNMIAREAYIEADRSGMPYGRFRIFGVKRSGGDATVGMRIGREGINLHTEDPTNSRKTNEEFIRWSAGVDEKPTRAEVNRITDYVEEVFTR